MVEPFIQAGVFPILAIILSAALVVGAGWVLSKKGHK